MPASAKVRDHMEQGGWIRRMFEAGIALKAQYGEDKVFDLSLGNPVVEPPAEFRPQGFWRTPYGDTSSLSWIRHSMAFLSCIILEAFA